ncbi:hypothetical protein BDFB_009288 [Asbolus verrucosus]|uniref:Uncharacterized protein n=1 Tax=Asbolus verrucosus TaxID=1661398 RepID=A0A482VYA7_ASBVE|nr:hypothetical protein BDFB_009288 [Asbolus verrucosus]
MVSAEEILSKQLECSKKNIQMLAIL